MRAWQIGEQKGLESLSLVERDMLQPRAGEAIVRVRASALNYRDLGVASAVYGMTRPADRIPLSDGAGEVVAVAPDVANVKIGDRVSSANFVNWIDGDFVPDAFSGDIGVSLNGWLTEYARLPAKALFQVPAGLSFEDAAAMTVAGGTAWQILVELGGL